MKLLLASVGNPDYGQDPEKRFPGCANDQLIEVNTLKEASITCRQYIEENELRGGNWSGGQVYQNNKLIAEIAYNGKAWAPGPEKKEITL